jgi:phenylacetate-CoA ligase
MIKITEDIRLRTPLIKDEWMTTLMKMREHEHSPEWNTVCGDRLTEDDIRFIKNFENNLENNRKTHTNKPPEEIIKWIKELAGKSWWFEDKLKNINIEKNFDLIPFMERSNLQKNLDLIIPFEEDLSRLIINPTSGTTGEPIPAPNHPKAIGCYDPLILFSLKRHGLKETFDYTKIAAIQICAQKKTITYNTVHSYLNGAGFAKINLAKTEWKTEKSPALFINDMAPVFYSGDPFAFFTAMKENISYKPKAILSTALQLSQALKNDLEKYYKCPAVNFYSLNETGPIAYSCPDHPGTFHILPADVYIETVDMYGNVTAPGETGELVITGGRNPFLPLLRYKTGDSGSLDFSECSCGDPMPKINGLSGRKPVMFFDENKNIINSIDISRVLRHYPVIIYQMIQEKNSDLTLRLLPSALFTGSIEKEISSELNKIFGKNIKISIKKDIDSSEKKIIPYINESCMEFKL